jgi:aspartyl-tRNA(Asn)/glutamyl-tRNA(Gln) amidotransferase subunit B
MMSSGTISPTVSKAVIKEIIEQRGGDPVAIVEEKGLKQVTDEAAIERAVDSVIAANPQKADEARAKPKMASWFVGQVMKATGGKANPQSVTAILKRRLGLPDEG